MLDGLVAIDWAALHHAYGPATDVPDQLRALISPDPEARREALHDLQFNVMHQGCHWPGCVEVVPFLVELLADEAVVDKPGLLAYLLEIAIGGLPPCLTCPPRRPRRDGATEDDELARRAFAAVAAATPCFVALLGHADAATRMTAALLVAWLEPTAGSDAVARLAALLDDRDDGVAASAALALGVRGHEDPRLHDLAAHRDRALVSAAAAIALGWLGHRDAVIDRLEATIRRPPPCDGFAWGEGLDLVALQVVLPLDGATRPETIAAVMERLQDGPCSSEAIADPLLGWAFPGPPDQRERLVEELGEPQLHVARAVLAQARGWALYTEVLRGRGLPATAARLAIFLGEAPPDRLERRIRFAHRDAWHWWPVWKCLLVAALDLAVDGADAVAVDAAATQLARELAPLDLAWLAVRDGQAVTGCWAGASRDAIHAVTARALELGLGDDALRPLAVAAQDHARLPSSWRLAAVLEACVAGVQAGARGFAPADQPMLAVAVRFAPPVAPLRPLLAGLAAPALEAVLLAALELAAPAEDPRVPLGVWRFLDLGPSPAVLRAAAAQLDRLPVAAVDEPAVLALIGGLDDDGRATLAAGPGERGAVMVRRAAIRQRGVITDAEVRVDLRQRFRDGVQLYSHDEEGDPLDPCPLCAQVYRELGLADLGPGARGGILAPNGEGGAGPRERTTLSGGFLVDDLVARQDVEPRPPPDPAVQAAIDDAIAHRTAAGAAPAAGALACCELDALHLLAARIRAVVVDG